jgi:hypothetical protein
VTESKEENPPHGSAQRLPNGSYLIFIWTQPHIPCQLSRKTNPTLVMAAALLLIFQNQKNVRQHLAGVRG